MSGDNISNIEVLRFLADKELKLATKLPYIIEDNPDDAEDFRELSGSGKRMQIKRKRERNADLYWRLRICNGVDNRALINDALEHAPKIVESARLKAIKTGPGFAAAYPERCKPIKLKGVTQNENKKCDGLGVS